MFRISLLCVFATVALGQPQGSGTKVISGSGTLSSGVMGPGANTQSQSYGTQVGGGGGTLASGATVQFRTMVEPALAIKSLDTYGGAVSMSGNTVHRVLVDRLKQSYLGYDLEVESGDKTSGYRVSIQPVSGMDSMLRSIFGGALPRPMPLPKFPPPQVVQEGDTIALDLMVSADGKKKLVDYVQISSPAEPAPATTTAEPRDFSVDDGPITVDFFRATIWIDGRKCSGIGGFETKSGATFWFSFPGQGRHILSLAPHSGFQKSGEIRDNVISFQDGDQAFEIRLVRPIAGAGKAWNLYMLHDPLYQPKANDAVLGGVDRLENLLPKQ